jgi:hypothetical protein
MKRASGAQRVFDKGDGVAFKTNPASVIFLARAEDCQIVNSDRLDGHLRMSLVATSFVSGARRGESA